MAWPNVESALGACGTIIGWSASLMGLDDDGEPGREVISGGVTGWVQVAALGLWKPFRQ
jgi:hypothetical protein